MVSKVAFSGRRTAIFFLSLIQTDFGGLLEPPHRGGSNEHPKSAFKQN